MVDNQDPGFDPQAMEVDWGALKSNFKNLKLMMNTLEIESLNNQSI
jgi:hypothetical protein